MSFSTVGLRLLLGYYLFHLTLFLQCIRILGKGVDSFSFKTMSATLDAEEALEPNPFLVPPQAEEQGLINSKAENFTKQPSLQLQLVWLGYHETWEKV